MTIKGTSDDDLLIGTPGDDQFGMSQGGDDTVDGDDGRDIFKFGVAFTAGDHIDGGADFDRLLLDGDYSAGVAFGADTLVNVERISVVAGHSYNLTSDDATIAAGETLLIDAKTLGAEDSLIFDGSAESDGQFVLWAGAGADVLTGGAKDDVFRLRLGGTDVAHGGGGNDTFVSGAAFSAADHIDGGAGLDALSLNGNYSAGVAFGAATLTHVERIDLVNGHSYNLTSHDATVAAGKTLVIDATTLDPADSLTFRRLGRERRTIRPVGRRRGRCAHRRSRE